MAQKRKKSADAVAVNRRATFDYAIEDEVEAGLVLIGSEVKSLRLGGANITDAHAAEKDGELYLFNLHIPEYKQANIDGHTPRRARKLLLKKSEIDRLLGAVQRKGYTLIPIRLYFNKRGYAKCLLGLGKGKKLYDKREDKKQKDWDRQKARLQKY